MDSEPGKGSTFSFTAKYAAVPGSKPRSTSDRDRDRDASNSNISAGLISPTANARPVPASEPGATAGATAAAAAAAPASNSAATGGGAVTRGEATGAVGVAAVAAAAASACAMGSPALVSEEGRRIVSAPVSSWAAQQSHLPMSLQGECTPPSDPLQQHQLQHQHQPLASVSRTISLDSAGVPAREEGQGAASSTSSVGSASAASAGSSHLARRAAGLQYAHSLREVAAEELAAVRGSLADSPAGIPRQHSDLTGFNWLLQPHGGANPVVAFQSASERGVLTRGGDGSDSWPRVASFAAGIAPEPAGGALGMPEQGLVRAVGVPASASASASASGSGSGSDAPAVSAAPAPFRWPRSASGKAEVCWIAVACMGMAPTMLC